MHLTEPKVFFFNLSVDFILSLSDKSAKGNAASGSQDDDIDQPQPVSIIYLHK